MEKDEYSHKLFDNENMKISSDESFNIEVSFSVPLCQFCGGEMKLQSAKYEGKYMAVGYICNCDKFIFHISYIIDYYNEKEK